MRLVSLRLGEQKRMIRNHAAGAGRTQGGQWRRWASRKGRHRLQRGSYQVWRGAAVHLSGGPVSPSGAPANQNILREIIWVCSDLILALLVPFCSVCRVCFKKWMHPPTSHPQESKLVSVHSCYDVCIVVIMCIFVIKCENKGRWVSPFSERARSSKLDWARVAVHEPSSFSGYPVGKCNHIPGYSEARECVYEKIWYFPQLTASRIRIDSALSRFSFRKKENHSIRAERSITQVCEKYFGN